MPVGLNEIKFEVLSNPRAAPWDEAEAVVGFPQKIRDVVDRGYGNPFDEGRYEQAAEVLADTVLAGEALAITIEVDNFDVSPLTFDAEIAAKVRMDRQAREQDEERPGNPSVGRSDSRVQTCLVSGSIADKPYAP